MANLDGVAATITLHCHAKHPTHRTHVEHVVHVEPPAEGRLEFIDEANGGPTMRMPSTYKAKT
jgi:hypothetical protein